MRRLGPTLLVALATAAGCEESTGGEGTAGTGGLATAPPPLPCEPATTVPCPCIGGGMGAQTCGADGASYEPCTGCLPAAPSLAPPTSGSGGGVAPDATTAPDAGLDASSELGSSGDAGPGLGPSCGVGLPILCELDVELCCVRSLATDTCVPADVAGRCSCDLADCQVLEVRCDGPEDCLPGEVCCGTLSGGSVYTSFECSAECRYTSDQRQACHVGTDTCPATPTPHVCANSQLLTNVQVCIDPATIEQ